MRAYPAVDILDGHVVRLAQGDFARSTTYASAPLDAARAWAEQGAEQLHIVDLDGARRGEPVNIASVREIVAETGLFIQLGGGLRSSEAVDAAAATGVHRMIIGTAAFDGSPMLEHALHHYGPERVTVSVDARSGLVAKQGWLETSTTPTATAVGELVARGVTHFIYTDVERDGTLAGPNLEAVGEVAAVIGGDLLYAGGIGELDDLRALVELGHPRLAGVIIGKALYERRFTLAQAMAALCN
jgi:phosphoribosylformimino-5-aminoimidazole carboxamide ribotide isomerase